MFERVAPLLFVVLWATGFIVARLVRPFVEPEAFVALRFTLSVVVLAIIALVSRARWPRTAGEWSATLLAGMLMQGLYIGGVFYAIMHGLSAAVAALIAGTQPLFTGALAGPLLREHVSKRRWLGIVIGFAGAVLVIIPNLSGAAAVPPSAVIACLIGTAGMTLGTMWQKHTGAAMDLRSGATIQLLGGVAVTLPAALYIAALPPAESGRQGVDLATVLTTTPRVWIGLSWAIFVLSVATTLLLLRLLREGAVARVSTLFYLVPPVTALMALALFGDALLPVQIVGMAVAAMGVAVANRG